MPPVIAFVVGTLANIIQIGAQLIGIAVGDVAAIAIAEAVTMTGLMMGANALVNAIGGALRHPDSVKTEAATSQLSVREPISAQRIVYGTTRLGGIITFIAFSGSSNDYVHMVITLAGHEIESIGNTLHIEDEDVTFAINGGGQSDGAWWPTSGKYVGHIQMEKHLGDPDDTSQPFPKLAVALPSNWTASHLQRGCAKVHLRFKWNQDVFTSGLPQQISFDLQGRKCYDPRTDTTVFTNNSALCLRDFLTDTIFGMAVPSADIDDDYVIAAANICDEAMALRGGGTQARYTCDGAFTTDVMRGEVIKSIAASMAGMVVAPSDQWCMWAGAHRESVLSLTDDDLRGSIRYDTRVSRRELANGIKGTYVSPQNKWQVSDFPPYRSSGYVTEDGEEIWKSIALDFTTDPVRAQRLAKIELERTRRRNILLLPCKLSALSVQPGDVVEFTHERWNMARTFLVSAWSLSPDTQGEVPAIGVDLSLMPVDANVYSWDPNTDEGTVDPVTTPPLTDSANVGAPTGLVLLSDSTTAVHGVTGLARPQIKVTWTPPTDVQVLSGGFIEIWIKRATDSAYRLDGRADGNDSLYFANKDLVEGMIYDIKINSVNGAGAHSAALTDSAVASTSLATRTAHYVIANGDFELAEFDFANFSAPLGWAKVLSPTLSWEKGAPYAGARSLKLSASDHFVGIRTAQRYACAPGMPFRIRCAGRYLSGVMQPRIYIWFADANGVGITAGILNFSKSDIAWHVYEKSYTAPAGAVSFFVTSDCERTPSAGLTVWELDAVELARVLGSVDVSPTMSPSIYTGPNPLHQSGTTTTILVDAFSLLFASSDGAGRTVSFSAGSVNPGSYGTWYVYCDDVTASGGVVPFLASASPLDVMRMEGRIYLGTIPTASGGGGGGTGGGGGGGGGGGRIYIP